MNADWREQGQSPVMALIIKGSVGGRNSPGNGRFLLTASGTVCYGFGGVFGRKYSLGIHRHFSVVETAVPHNPHNTQRSSRPCAQPHM